MAEITEDELRARVSGLIDQQLSDLRTQGYRMTSNINPAGRLALMLIAKGAALLEDVEGRELTIQALHGFAHGLLTEPLRGRVADMPVPPTKERH